MQNSPSAYYISRGPRWWQTAHNRLVDLIFEIQPLAGSGLLRNDSKHGRMLSVSSQSVSRGGGGDPTYAFGISLTTVDNVQKVLVNYGTVLDLLDDSYHVPTGMSLTTDYLLNAEPDASYYVSLTYDVDTDTGRGTITSVTIGPSDITNPGSALSIQIGATFTETQPDGSVTQNIASYNVGHLGWMYCDQDFWWSTGAGE